MKRIIILLAAALALSAQLSAVVPNRAVFPDIPGYVTLKGDFHVHTVFSDGSTWPVDRIREATYEGLDFLSITDHMEPWLARSVNAGYLDAEKVNRNTSYEIARKAAGKSLLVIHGAELSRGTGRMPGHYNTHFISDGNAIFDAAEAAKTKFKDDLASSCKGKAAARAGKDPMDDPDNDDKAEEAAIKAGLQYAREQQDAFIVWNHPQWQNQAHNGVEWLPIHQWAWKNGYMQGIEIVNHDCSDMVDRKAFHWAMEKGLTVVSGTDCHGPMYEIVDRGDQMFRAMTLIFATEKSVDGIRDALVNGRSVVFADNHLYGPEKYLAEMFRAIFKAVKVSSSGDKLHVRLRNDSSIPVEISKREDTHTDVYISSNPYRLNRGEEQNITFRTCDGRPIGDSVTVDLIVHNFWCDVDTPIQVECTFSK